MERLKLEISKDTKSSCNLPELFLICKILGTLPEEYFSFKSSWMLMGKSERTIDTLTTQLCAYEKALNAKNAQNCGEALVVKPGRKVNGHNVSCKDSVSKFSKQKRSLVCHYCKQSGHKVRQCNKWKADGRPAKPSNELKTSNFNKSEEGDSGINMGLMTFCEVNITGRSDEDYWYVDNGATNHVTFKDDLFQTFEPFVDRRVMKTANGESVCALGKGTVEVEAAVNGKWIKHRLLDVWYVPSIKKNLFSVLATQDLHLNSEFISRTESCFLKVDGDVKLFGSRLRKGGLYKLALRAVKPMKPIQVNTLTSDENLLQIYHERLGHQNKRHVKATIERELGVKLKLDSELCEGCIFGKSHRLKFGTRERATIPGELIHTDVCGPFVSSVSGFRYFLLFKDDFSRYRRVYFLRQKSEVPEKLKQFLAECKTSAVNVKELLSDNGGEFDSGIVRQILQDHGIKQRLTMPYTPEQNGCSERDNRTLVEAARAMMHAHEAIPERLWAEMINTAAYILNRTGQSSVPEKSPIELWSGKKPVIKNLRIIGCTCYAHVPKPKRKKMEKKSVKGILIGYDNNDGYRIWCKENNTLIRSRDVIFQEKPMIQRTIFPLPNQEEVRTEVEETKRPDFEEIPEIQESPRYELRKREDIQPPKRMEDYIMFAISNVSDIYEPQHYWEAMQSQERENWKKAMEDEMKSHETNQTWTLEELPNGKKCIPCKWVYKVKTNPDGSVDRFKARLVIKGYSQQKGVDYFETFSPVARLGTIRALLSTAANEKMSLKQFDVSTAFLYGNLEETVYMKQPEGYDDGSGRVCRLMKSLYGLKQAPRCWNKRIGNFLIQLGLKQSEADPCLFVRKEGSKKLLLALYVDDGLVAPTHPEMLEDFMNSLKQEFKIVDKPASYFLGLEIKQAEDGSVRISQEGYTKRLLKRFGMEDCKPATTPIIKDKSKGKVETQEDEVYSKEYPYRECVGSLMYLVTGSRPDIAFAVGKASRSLENPSYEDWIKVKRILRYLKGTVSLCLEYKSNHKSGMLECFSDADHSGDECSGRSTTGVVCLNSGGAITWFSQRQSSVAISSTEAEVVAANEACREIVWLVRLLEDITMLIQLPILNIDNVAAIRLAENPENHRRTKHIQTRHFFVREMVSEGKVEVKHMPAEFQLADCLTKPQHKPRLKTVCEAMGLKPMDLSYKYEGKC